MYRFVVTVFQVLKNFFRSTVQIAAEKLPFSWGKLIFQFLLPVALYFVFYKLILLLFKRIFRDSKMRNQVKKKVLLWIKRILRILFVVLVGILVGRLFGAKILTYLGLFFKVLSKPFFESGSTKISIITIILTIPIFYLATWIAKAIRAFFDRTVLHKLGLDESKKFSISNLIRYIVLIIVLLIGLSIIGINLSSLAVIFGVLGIGLGFGLQNLVANLFAGIVIILTHPIKEGDRVLVMDSEGVVIKIRAVATVINTIKNETIVVPNSQITQEKVYNYSYDDRSIFVETSVEVAYTADLEKAVAIMKDIGKRNPYRISSEDVIVRVSSFENSGIKLLLFVKITDVNDKYASISWSNMEIWREFKKNSVEIPFPQVDIHFRNAIPGKKDDSASY